MINKNEQFVSLPFLPFGFSGEFFLFLAKLISEVGRWSAIISFYKKTTFRIVIITGIYQVIKLRHESFQMNGGDEGEGVSIFKNQFGFIEE